MPKPASNATTAAPRPRAHGLSSNSEASMPGSSAGGAGARAVIGALAGGRAATTGADAAGGVGAAATTAALAVGAGAVAGGEATGAVATGAGAGAGGTGVGLGAGTDAAATGGGAAGAGGGVGTLGVAMGAVTVAPGLVVAAGTGAAAVLAPGADAAPANRFRSSTFLASSATRVEASFFSRSRAIFSSCAPAFAPAAPLLKVSLSGVGAAACLRSSTLASTLPPAWRAEPSVFASGTPPARRWRYAPKSALCAWMTSRASVGVTAFAVSALGTDSTTPAFSRFMLFSTNACG